MRAGGLLGHGLGCDGDVEEAVHRVRALRRVVAQAAQQAPGILQVLLGFEDAGRAVLAQALHQLDLQQPQRVDALGGHVEPGVAQVAVQRGAGAGHAQRAPQALQLGHARGQLLLLPARAQGRVGKLGKHAQAALLRIDQVQHALLVRIAALAGREEQRAHGPLLACFFLRLHQVQQGHELARDTGQSGRIGHVEDQFDQPGDQVAERGNRVVRRHRLLVDLAAQRGQRIEPQQRPRHQRQGLGRGALGGLDMLGKLRAQLGFEQHHLLHDAATQVGKALCLGGQVHARCTALALQALDQLADHVHQRSPAGQVVHRIDLELARAQHEAGNGQGRGGQVGHAVTPGLRIRRC